MRLLNDISRRSCGTHKKSPARLSRTPIISVAPIYFTEKLRLAILAFAVLDFALRAFKLLAP